MADDPNENNTDKEFNAIIEQTFVGGNYYVSLGQYPKVETSVYKDS